MTIARGALLALFLASLPPGAARAEPSWSGARPAPASAAPSRRVPRATGDTLTVASPANLWPKVGGVATVYYVIDPASDPAATPNIAAAIKISNADFPNLLQWVPWTAALGSNYVDINLAAGDTSGVCEAAEGYAATPAQPMGGSAACTIGTILHEMGHVIGLYHEHQRSDRASYVTVSYANVIKGSWGNFTTLAGDEEILGPYDYASVMQYIPFAFSRNGLPVIETLPAGMPLAGFEGVPAEAPPTGPALPAFDYSAGDKETIARLYGAAPTEVTVTSNPVGLSLVVDGTTITTPQRYAWPLYSTHTLAAPTGVESLPGYVLYSNPPVAATFYYAFGRWNNATTATQTVTVLPGDGSPAFPTSAPALATYAANFVQLVPYATTAVYPAGAGSASVAPAAASYGVAGGAFYVARSTATLTAAPVAGWQFYEFINGPFWLPGGLAANPKTFLVPDSGNPLATTAYFSSTPVYTVDATPETPSSNLSVSVDGVFAYTPTAFSADYDASWTPGSRHTLAFASPEYPYSANSRYAFAGWSDGGAAAHTIAALPATATTYLVTVTPQFAPATNFAFPPCGGGAALSPGSPTNDGFYPAGQVLGFGAAAASGWTFAGWTYDLTGTADPASLTADDETLVYANFNTTATPLTLAALSPTSAVAGSAALKLTLTGTGFTRASATELGTQVSVNGSYRTVTYLSPTSLTVSLTKADLASPAALPVFVEGYPKGWTGCANFGYETFVVEGKGAPAATPVFAPAAGRYASAQTVTISDALAGAAIHYTTDGKDPTASSPVYEGPLTVAASGTLKALAILPGYLDSPVASAKYTIR
jgi:hypothetical protein